MFGVVLRSRWLCVQEGLRATRQTSVLLGQWLSSLVAFFQQALMGCFLNRERGRRAFGIMA
eukprot:3293433-Amphidinium_carterae.1